MDNIERINEMRKINFNLDKRLDDYNKNVTDLRNQLESGNLDPREFQKSMERMIERRMEIAEQVGRYDQLATKGADEIGGPSQTGQVARAKTMLDGPLADFPLDADKQKLFDQYLGQALQSHDVIDEYTDEIRDRQEDTARRDKHAAGAENAPTGVRNREAEDYFKNDIKVKGDERAIAEYDRIKQQLADRLAPKPPVAEATHSQPSGPIETFVPLPQPAPAAAPPQAAAPAEAKALTKEEITNIQKQLKALHFNVDVTGEIDHKTQIAFRAFTWDLQALAAKNGKDVPVNGIYDDKTAAAMRSMPEGDLKIPSYNEDTRFHRRAQRAGETDGQYARSLLDAAKAMNLSGEDNKVRDLSKLAVPASSTSTTAAYNNNASTEAIRERTLFDVARPLINVSGPVRLSTLLDRFGERNFDGMKNRPLAEFEKHASDAFNTAGGSDMFIHHGNRAELKRALEEVNKRGGLGASDQEIDDVVNRIIRLENRPAHHAVRHNNTGSSPAAAPPPSATGEDPNQPCVDPSLQTQQTINADAYRYYGWERPTR